MTLSELSALAERDEKSGIAKRLMAGGYARHAVESLRHHDWQAATDYLLQAIRRCPDEYAPALALVERCR